MRRHAPPRPCFFSLPALRGDPLQRSVFPTQPHWSHFLASSMKPASPANPRPVLNLIAVMLVASLPAGWAQTVSTSAKSALAEEAARLAAPGEHRPLRLTYTRQF